MYSVVTSEIIAKTSTRNDTNKNTDESMGKPCKVPTLPRPHDQLIVSHMRFGR